jgi:hypothetical protein
MFWIQLIILLIAIYLAVSTQPKSTVAKPQAFEEFEFPQVDEGTPEYVFFGDCWTGDWLVLAVGDYKTTSIKTKSGK